MFRGNKDFKELSTTWQIIFVRRLRPCCTKRHGGIRSRSIDKEQLCSRSWENNGARNCHFNVFCMEYGIYIRKKYRARHQLLSADADKRQNFTTWFRQKWNVTTNGWWKSCRQMKPTFHCVVLSISKALVCGRRQIIVHTWSSHFTLLCDGLLRFHRVFHCEIRLRKSLYRNWLEKLQSHWRTVCYVEWLRCACIVEKTWVTFRYFLAEWYPALRCTWNRNVPVGNFHWSGPEIQQTWPGHMFGCEDT